MSLRCALTILAVMTLLLWLTADRLFTLAGRLLAWSAGN